MRLEEWKPESGWRMERKIHVMDCPTCGELSEFYLCDVFGCMNIDFAAGYKSKTAERYVTICSDHAAIATREERESETHENSD